MTNDEVNVTLATSFMSYFFSFSSLSLFFFFFLMRYFQLIVDPLFILIMYTNSQIAGSKQNLKILKEHVSLMKVGFQMSMKT